MKNTVRTEVSASGALHVKGTVRGDVLTGSEGDDEFDANKGDDLIFGLGGNDDLDGDKGADTLYGGAGNDTLDGEMDDDLMFGGDGSDLFVLRSNRGNDTIGDFTVGEDLLRIRFSTAIKTFDALQPFISTNDEGNAVIDLGRGDSVTLLGVSGDALSESDFQFGGSRIEGTDGDDTVSGGDDDDEINGGAGNDTVSGDEGSDTISGGDGLDVIYGNLDNDTLLGDGGDDSLYGGQADDDLSGGGGNDVLYGNLAEDTLTGSEGDDTLFGGQGSDLVLGGTGNDILFGNRADDTLSGGTGDDVLSGGLGNDQFAFADASGNDTIADFDPAAAGETVTLSANINGTGIANFTDVAARLTDDGVGNTVLDLGGGNTITFIGVQSGDLASDDFIFG